MANRTVRRADSDADRAACYAIRAAVFAGEQGVQGETGTTRRLSTPSAS
ncbi:MAG: hypothetical protein LC793_13805 [Thermomicrobia bacterium]|nr:hypothetical protein [Thermomicrobia bacterium]